MDKELEALKWHTDASVFVKKFYSLSDKECDIAEEKYDSSSKFDKAMGVYHSIASIELQVIPDIVLGTFCVICATKLSRKVVSIADKLENIGRKLNK